jgi:hypothetical protein
MIYTLFLLCVGKVTRTKTFINLMSQWFRKIAVLRLNLYLFEWFVITVYPCINFTLIHDNMRVVKSWSFDIIVCEIHKSLFIVEFKSALCKFFFCNVCFFCKWVRVKLIQGKVTRTKTFINLMSQLFRKIAVLRLNLYLFEWFVIIECERTDKYTNVYVFFVSGFYFFVLVV